jgi:hypothetical protein
MTLGRRQLDFQAIDEIVADVDHLLKGHRTVGRWSLAQILNHCGSAGRWCIDGFPVKTAPWVVRTFLGPFARRSMLVRRRIPEGFPLPRRYQPLPDLDLSAEAASFRAALERVKGHEGTFAAHPFAGTMTRDEWVQYHCVHCAHHLSFAVPRTEPEGARR